MTIAFRDLTVVIIETSRTHVRAALGLHDLLKTPSVEIQARVGLRRSALPEPTSLNGNGFLKPGDYAEDGRPSASTSRASSLPHQVAPEAKVNDYLVGPQLDEALAAGQDIAISWPFADGDVRDWTQAEAIWKYILFKHLGIRRLQNESPVILSIPHGLPRDTYERISQIFFERFNVAGLALLDRPTAQLYAANALTGVVVDVGLEQTDITPIFEGLPIRTARSSTRLGIKVCEAYLAQLLTGNAGVVNALSPADAPLERAALMGVLRELARTVWQSGLVKVPSDGEATAPPPEDEGVTDIAAVLVAGKEKAVIEAGTKKKNISKASAAELQRAKEIEALDLVTVSFRDLELTLGKERHRFCEPLFDPGLLDILEEGIVEPAVERPMAIQDAIGHAIGLTDAIQRQEIWEGVFVTGDLATPVKGLGTALQSRLSPFILSNADQMNDVQPKSVRILTVPEYFAEYRDRGNSLAAFLGTSIVGKVTFNDSFGKNYVSKADYTEKGPKAIIEMSPSLF